MLETLRGADVLVTHPTFGSATVPAAQHLGVPVVVGQLFPMMIPTALWGPPIGVTNLNLRWRPLHRLAWRGFAWGSGAWLYDRAINRYRRSLGLESLRGNALLSWTAAARTVVLVSRHYFGDEPPDWGEWRLHGFSAWPGPAGARLDDEVEQFIADGEPPVLVCLGTSAAAGAGHAFVTIADGLQQRGHRALLLVGNQDNLAAVRLAPGAFEFAPVPDVVVRCAAAVVSGALGTLSAALSAGVPVVVLPQLFDQLWHGRRVEKLGVGIMVTRPSQVPAAVAQLLSDPDYARRARELGAKLRAEDGAAALVAAVEATI
jgi:UDP:flavonoid glycosyltransferase YjiC (YdhE family)